MADNKRTPDSWEDAAGDEDSLAKQTGKLNMGQNDQQQQQHQQSRSAFRPNFNAPAFTPNAPSFTPGAGSWGGVPQQMPQYGQYQQFNQYQN